MTQLLSYLATFGGGTLTGYILQLLQESRHQTKAISREVYVPIRQRLAKTRPALPNGNRFDAYHEWQTIKDSGFMARVPKKIRARLFQLFDVTLPNYDKSCREFDSVANQLARQWEQQFGVVMPGGTHFRYVNWWVVLAADRFEWTEAEPLEGEALNVGTRVLTKTRLRELNVSLKEFAFDRWQENYTDAAIVAYREARKSALTEIDAMLELLGKNIRL